MNVGSILNLLNMLNKSILCEPLESILFYSTCSINLVINLHKHNKPAPPLFPKKELFDSKIRPFFTDAPIM